MPVPAGDLQRSPGPRHSLAGRDHRVMEKKKRRTGKGKGGARGLGRERVERKAGRKRKGIREGEGDPH